MKKLIILTVAVLCAAMAVAADKSEVKQKKTFQDPVKFAFGVQTGIDIGAAVPWPPGKTIGGQNKMSATPHLTPALGFSYTMIINPHWSLTLESTYKTVALDAKAWVEDQRFKDRDEDVMVSFRGTAYTEMSFPMLEFPLYVRYTIGKSGNNRVFFGGYYAWEFNSKFIATPQKGVVYNIVDGKPDEANPKTFVEPDEPYVRNFSDKLSNWDAGFLLGYERAIFNRVTLSGRFSMGLKDIFRQGEECFDYNMLHMRGTLTVSYMFMKK